MRLRTYFGLAPLGKQFALAITLLGLFSIGTATATEPEAVNEKPKPKSQAGLFYRAGNVKAGIRTFGPGDLIVRQPTLWGLSAKLTMPATIKLDSESLFVPDGVVLPAVKIIGLPNATGETIAFCTEAKKADKLLTTSAFGIFGAKIADSLTDGQKCLLDSDGDGNADQGFLLNDGKREDRLPRPISPVPLNIAELREPGLGYAVIIQLVKSKKPTFEIDILHDGNFKQFHTIDTTLGSFSKRISISKKVSLPQDLNVFGTKFRVQAFNAETGEVTLEFAEADEARLMPVPTETKVTYTYW
jgi:hypothetical protein